MELILRGIYFVVVSVIGGFWLIGLAGCQRATPEKVVLDSETVAAPTTDSPSIEHAKDVATLREETQQALQAGDVNAAGTAIRAAVVLAPDDPQLAFLMAIVLGAEHRFHEAVRKLDLLATAVPETRLPALGQTAEWLATQGEWQEAERRYRAVLDEVPDAAMAHRQLSQLMVRQGRRLDAAKHLQVLCRLGNIEEVELRSLLSLVAPFSPDAAREELQPIGSLGRARMAIAQDQWEQAAKELLAEDSPRPAEAALLGRVYAEQENFEALTQWVVERSKAKPETADHWYALGVDAAHRADHREAVQFFCQAVLLDATDEQVFRRLAESLHELSADGEAEQAAQRAQSLARTRALGNEMAGSNQRDLQKLAELSQLLHQLHRPLEAISWQAVRVAYAGSKLSPQEQQAKLAEINQQRMRASGETQPFASKEFILCGVDLDAIGAP